MKKFLALMIVMTLVGGALAQGGKPTQGGKPGQGGPGGGMRQMDPKQLAEMQKKRMDDMTKALGLKPDQVKKIVALDKKRMEDMMKLRKDNEGKPMTDMRTKMKPISDKYTADLGKILTKDQMKKYEEWRKTQRRGMGGPGGRGPGGPGGAAGGAAGKGGAGGKKGGGN